MSQVLDFEVDMAQGEIIIILGPSYAADVITLHGADAEALQRWLAAQEEAALDTNLFGISRRELRKREAPPISEEDEPPF